MFAENGDCVPVTVIAVDRCIPVLNRTQEKNGYTAVLVAYGEKKRKHVNKPQQGLYTKLKIEPAKVLAELRDEQVAEGDLNKQLSVSMFKPGDSVEVTLITPVAMSKELRFAIREGGRTVGAGVVNEVLE